MAKALISYDRDLPEIPERRAWEKPTSHLVKDESSPNGWREEKSGRRPSTLLLVPGIREAVDQWRDEGYPGASDVSLRLFDYWFEEEHHVPGFPVPFRFYFCQQEAIETLVWLVEVARLRDAEELIRAHASVRRSKSRLFGDEVVFQTTMDGKRQLRRLDPGTGDEQVQDLPPKDLRRYAFKMATGSGKTWVMAMAMVWSYFHKRLVPGSDLSTNFLLVAPNVIVFQRLEKDFGNGSIFNNLPLIPPEWRPHFKLKVIRREEHSEPDPSGNLFLTNIHQLYESRSAEWRPINAVEALLGPKPVKDLASAQRSMLERVKSLPDVLVINDEAHHVHDEDLEWSQSLLSIHSALPSGVSAWLDFSATPKDQLGMYFPWTVCDYPLAQAVEDRIVKVPIMVTREDDPELPKGEPDRVTRENVADKYKYWIRAAVHRWTEHHSIYRKLGAKPVLFIMTEKNAYADALGEHLRSTKEYRFKDHEVLVIHTDEKGEITKRDLEAARKAARDVDNSDNPIKAIVSVMMLREGWDVQNVTVVLGLRPFTSKAEILPEQVIGRGLRLMRQPGIIGTQTLEVLGTRKLLEVLRDQLEVEGVGVATSKTDPPRPVMIQPVQERLAYDISMPVAKLRIEHELIRLEDLDVSTLEPIFERPELAEPYRIRLRMDYTLTETEVHTEEIDIGAIPLEQDLISRVTHKTSAQARLPARFNELVPHVRHYVATRCFGKAIDLANIAVRSHLASVDIQDAIARYLAREIGRLTAVRRPLELDQTRSKLSDTLPFTWRRDLPPFKAAKTVFNYVATYNSFERRFAEFLDKAPDVLRFASLGTTEQGESGTQLRVDYLKPSGAVGRYHPDWVVVQQTGNGEANWIIETKGRVWLGTDAKDEAIQRWCEQVSRLTGERWQYARIGQVAFDRVQPDSLEDAVAANEAS